MAGHGVWQLMMIVIVLMMIIDRRGGDGVRTRWWTRMRSGDRGRAGGVTRAALGGAGG